ncbi:MAG: polysaccharide biosynthesis C-terminal domain-containing protein [Oscillospiraceae bacterium]|nr:polysaccharide biosynthesis C-terminal domain-containing protein [Oscillospiraceae bacterium]
MIKQLLEKVRHYAKEGLFHIFGSKVIAQVGGLISSMLVIRFLDKVEYGHYVNAVNLYSYPAIFVGLGMTNVIMQYCSEKVTDERKASIYRHGLLVGHAANFLVVLSMLAMAFWKLQTGKAQTALFLVLMCGLPFVDYMNAFSQTALRVKLKNHVFSNANTICTVVLLLGNIILTKFFDVPGLIYSRYLSYFVAMVICMAALQKERFFNRIMTEGKRLEGEDRKHINNYAVVCAVTNFASAVLVLMDVTCLDLFLGDPAVLADYHVAAVIPSACGFIPSSLMVFFYPKLVAAISEGKKEGRAFILQLAKVYAVVNIFVYICLALFAPLIIWIIYGEKYMNVIPLFQILSVNYLFYCVRNLMGNTIAAIKKVKVNLIFAVISGVLNICLNMLLIPVLGSVGAAVATLIVTIVIAIMDCAYVMHHFRTET